MKGRLRAFEGGPSIANKSPIPAESLMPSES
jgi:hypothetical protein